jgi:orotidine-5'-phosphate decarboxylase
MSSKGSLATGDYTKEAVRMAIRNPDFVVGFIGQQRFTSVDGEAVPRDFLYLTPGVGLEAKGDALGQQYRTPHQVIVESGCDVIIVGRGIYGQGNVAENAQRYRQAGWEAYQSRIKRQ